MTAVVILVYRTLTSLCANNNFEVVTSLPTQYLIINTQNFFMDQLIPYNNTLELGKGFNSVKGKALGTIFQPDFELYDSIGAHGQEVQFSMKRIEEAEQLYEELGISVDVSGRYGLFSGDNKFKFASSSNFNSYSLFYLLSVKVTNAVKRIKKYHFVPEVMEMLKNGETERFRKGFGDAYIEAISTGGEFFALYEFYCSDENSKTQISNHLQAEYGSSLLAGVEVNVDIQSVVTSAIQKSQLRLTLYQSGGVGIEIPSNPEELMKRARNFPSIVMGDNGVMYGALYQSYETLPLPAGPNYVALENKKFVLDSYAKDMVKWRQTLAELDYIIDKPEEFEIDPESDEQMTAIIEQRTAVASIINDYTGHAIRCADSVAECEVFNPKSEDFAKIDKRKIPARKKSLDYVVIYDNINYTGKAQYLVKGKYKDGLKDLGLSNDSIKSIKIPSNWQVILFEHWYFNGRNLPLRESCPDLSVFTFSDITSSIFVSEVGETVTSENPPVAPPSAPSAPSKFAHKFSLLKDHAKVTQLLRKS